MVYFVVGLIQVAQPTGRFTFEVFVCRIDKVRDLNFGEGIK